MNMLWIIIIIIISRVYINNCRTYVQATLDEQTSAGLVSGRSAVLNINQTVQFISKLRDY